MRSGKNTFSDLLIDAIAKKQNNLRVGYDFFAKPVKDQCKEVFRNLTNHLNQVSTQYAIPELYTDDDNWYEDKNQITRILLQSYATDIFRDMVDENYWAKYLRDKANNSELDILCVTDFRFKSEIKTLKDSDSSFAVYSIRINRPSIIREDNDTNNHQSEIDLDDFQEFDSVVENTDFSSLIQQTEDIADLILEKYF